MKNKLVHTLSAAVLLSFGLLAFSRTALGAAYVDTTPYGLVYASGIVTGDGTGEAAADNQFYFSPKGQKRKVNVAFYRPPTGVATNPFTQGWLPGSVQIYNPDGTLLVNAANIKPTVFFPFFYSGTPMAIAICPITYKGMSADLVVTILPLSAGQFHFQVSILTRTDPTHPDNDTHVAFYHAGTLTGVAVIDP